MESSRESIAMINKWIFTSNLAVSTCWSRLVADGDRMIGCNWPVTALPFLFILIIGQFVWKLMTAVRRWGNELYIASSFKLKWKNQMNYLNTLCAINNRASDFGDEPLSSKSTTGASVCRLYWRASKLMTCTFWSWLGAAGLLPVPEVINASNERLMASWANWIPSRNLEKCSLQE